MCSLMGALPGWTLHCTFPHARAYVLQLFLNTWDILTPYNTFFKMVLLLEVMMMMSSCLMMSQPSLGLSESNMVYQLS